MKIRYFFIMLFCVVIIAAVVVTFVEKKDMRIKNKERIDIEQMIDVSKKGKKSEKGNLKKTESNKESELKNIELEGIEKLYAKSACVIDAESKRVLYAKDAYNIMSMASTTKIMTCIIALESGYVDEKAIVSNYAATMPNVQLNVVPGEIITIRDMLYSLMLESHNDIAVVIAENIALYSLNDLKKDNNIDDYDRDINIQHNKENNKAYDYSKYSTEGYKDINQSKSLVKIFAQIMNNKAKQLGMINTSFVTPNGLDADNHHTTAYDMALLGSYAIQNKEFLEIVGRKNYTLKSYKVSNNNLELYKKYTVYNKDMFLDMYKGAIGCKTGYTSKAGYCFVGAVERSGYKLVSVVLASGWPPNKNYKWQDTIELMDGAIANYNPKTVKIDNSVLKINPIEVKKASNICNEKINDATSNKYNLLSNNKDFITYKIDKTYNMLLSDKDKLSYKVYMPLSYMAPVRKGDIVGKYEIYLNGDLYASERITSAVNIEKHSYKRICLYLIKQIFKI